MMEEQVKASLLRRVCRSLGRGGDGGSNPHAAGGRAGEGEGPAGWRARQGGGKVLEADLFTIIDNGDSFALNYSM